MTQATTAPAPTTDSATSLAVTPTHAPSPLEQQHIDRALEASQTSMDAISTLLSMSQWTLGILALIVGIIAIFGWGVIRNGVLAQAKQIANKRMADYIKSEEFSDMLTAKIDEAIERREEDKAAQRLTEERRPQGEAPAFKELK